MTNSQRTVIWLGLILIVLNLTTKWSQVKTVIFGGSTTTASTTSTTPTTTPAKTTPVTVQAV